MRSFLHEMATISSVILAAARLGGQAAPSDRILHPRLLRIGVDSFSVFSIRGTDTALIGWARDELQMHGERLSRIYTEVDKVFGTWSDTIISDAHDLTPLWHASASSWFTARLRYSKTSVIGWTKVSDSTPVALRYQVTGPVDDPAMFDVIARASSLRPASPLEGFAFDAVTRTVKPYNGSVTDSLTIDGRPCWVFRGNNGGLLVVFWIDRASRALIRSVVRLHPTFSLLLIAEHSR